MRHPVSPIGVFPMVNYPYLIVVGGMAAATALDGIVYYLLIAESGRSTVKDLKGRLAHSKKEKCSIRRFSDAGIDPDSVSRHLSFLEHTFPGHTAYRIHHRLI